MRDLSAGLLLVAAPVLVDPNFADAVVLLLDVDEEGALGVVLNRPSPVLVGDVLADWAEVVDEPEVLFRGGPVSTEGALAIGRLADPGATPPVGFRPVLGDLGVIDLEAPTALVGAGLRDLRIFAGYAGWGADQLQAEVAEGSWYVVPAEPADPFRAEVAGLWRDVLRRQPGELAWHATRPADPDLN